MPGSVPPAVATVEIQWAVIPEPVILQAAAHPPATGLIMTAAAHPVDVV